MTKINLSYTITTYNKINSLKVIISTLLNNINDDEEIVVVDGGSSDGTQDYLTKLLNEGKINKYISERDKGESHGTNKAFLMAEGKLIKLLTDDDVFYHPVIKEMKSFMLEHPEIDVMGGNTCVTYTDDQPKIKELQQYQNDFFDWKEGKIKNFVFCMTPVLIRRHSLALTGLLNIESEIVDYDWTIRITPFVNLAWYTGYPVVNVINHLSKSNNVNTIIREWPKEWAKFVTENNWKPPKTIMRNYPFLPVLYKIYLTRWMFFTKLRLKYKLKHFKRYSINIVYRLFLHLGFIKQKARNEDMLKMDFESIYSNCMNWLDDQNKKIKGEFIIKLNH